MKNIYLVGFMASGKSVTGRLLAERLALEFVEMDEAIEKAQGKEIAAIFAQEGEGYFRQLENDLLKELAGKTGLVVSCGGGLICNQENLKILKSTGLVISLMAKPSTIYERTKKDTKRPLLNVDNPLAEIETLLMARMVYYKKADKVIATDRISPEQVVDEIMATIKNG
jgi:shikimate kinase